MLLAVAVCRPASAQYRIDSWTTDHGLPQNSVTSILQTRDGFLWLTTYGGLVRFDGANLEVFNTVNAPALRTSRFTNLFEARDGALWISTDGQGVTRYRDGTFASYTTADGLPENNVVAMMEDADGRLLFDTPQGLAVWQDGRFVAYRGHLPSARDATILSRTRRGVIWYRDAAGIHKVEDGRVARTVSFDVPVKRLYEDRQARIWLEIDGPERRLASFADGRLRIYSSKDGIPKFSTVSVSEDREGNVWFGLRAGGALLRFDGHGFTRIAVADGLPNDNVGFVQQDREGTLWVPTDGGLARLTARPVAAYSSEHGLEADNTYPILEDRRGDIWIGGWNGLTRFRDGRFTPAGGSLGLDGVAIQSLHEDRDGALWVGTWGWGVRRVRNGTVTSFPTDRPPGAVVRTILQGRGSEMWFGGQAGLTRLRDGAFTNMNGAGYAGGEVHALYEDRSGALWIGSDSGVARYRDGAFTHFGEKDGLTGRTVRAIHEDGEGTLWLGTYDTGLFRFRDGRFTRYTTHEGLPTNGAFAIVEDDSGRFWISSNLGIYRVIRRELEDVAAGRLAQVTTIPYGRRDGMLNSECNGGGQPAGSRARDGRIWFPTQKGVAILDPDHVPVNSEPPPVTITQVLVADERVPRRDVVEIRSGPRSLAVQYAALTFVRPELSRFRYKIEGLDDEWIDAGHARTARYAQLPYGRFRFRVIAANRDGVWNAEGATLDVVVVPPFWRTWWFLALMMAGTAAGGATVHRARMALVRRQREVQEAFSRQLIESQEQDRTRIAAGLHDGLSQNLIVIKNWAVVGRRALPGDHAVATRLDEIADAAAQALDEVREVVHDLVPYQLERLGLGLTLSELAQRVGDASRIRFSVSVPDPDPPLSKQARINLYRVIQEAINNVVKHSRATRAWLEVTVTEGVLRATVRDDGSGFDARSAPASRNGTGGFGLFGMSERMRMIGGTLAIDSAPGRGTSMTVSLPLEGQCGD